MITFAELQQGGYPRPTWSMPRPPDGNVTTSVVVTGTQQRPWQPPVDDGTRPPGQLDELPGGQPSDPSRIPLNNQYLWQQYAGYQQPQGFQYQQQQVQPPQGYQAPAFAGQYQPQQAPQAFGYSPFSYSPEQMAGPQAGQIGQFNMGAYGAPPGLGQAAAYQPVQGPQALQAPGFQAQQTPMQGQLEQSLAQGLAQPSAYGSANIQSQFDILNRRLGQEYDVQRQGITEDMARRGLTHSTLAGGRYGDVAVKQGQAQADLAQSLLNQSAQQYGQDRQAAIAQAMGYGGLQFGNQLAGYQANLAGTAQNFQQDLATRAFQGDQNAMAALNALQQGQFGLQQQGQQFGQGLTGFQANLGAQGQQFGQQLAQGQFGQSELARQFGQGQQAYSMNLAGQQQAFGQGLAGQQFAGDEQQRALQQGLQTAIYNAGQGQQGFQNEMQRAAFQAQQGQQGFGNQLAAYQANLGGQQQGFAQQQQLLQNLLGYGQQGFENQFQQQQWQDAQRMFQEWLAMHGTGV